MVKRVLPFLALLAAAGLARAVAPDLAGADQLVRAGKAEEAWQLLAPHEFELAGEPDFDYLLGIAALDAGHPDRATLAFERVLALNPGHMAARLDMARAYFALGDQARAKIEFEAVLRLEPPTSARATIERYLALIAEQAPQTRLRLSAYGEASLGRDSNLNAGASGGSYYLPSSNTVVAATGKGVAYQSVAAGFELAYTLSEHLDLLAGADYRQRNNRQDWVDSSQSRRTDYYDNRGLDLRVGLEARVSPQDALRLVLSRNNSDLDDTQYFRRIQGLMAEWRRVVDSRSQIGLFALDQRLRYGTVQGTDYRQYGGDQLLVGFGVSRIVAPARAAFVYGSVYGGGERATDSGAGNLDGDKRLIGAKVGGQLGLAQNLDLAASVGRLDTRYQLTNSQFLERRQDSQLDVNLGLHWRFARDWQLKPQYVFTRAESNLGAYDYQRHDLSLTLRYDLR